MADLLSVLKGEFPPETPSTVRTTQSVSLSTCLRECVYGMLFFTPTPLPVLMQAELEPPHAA